MPLGDLFGADVDQGLAEQPFEIGGVAAVHGLGVGTAHDLHDHPVALGDPIGAASDKGEVERGEIPLVIGTQDAGQPGTEIGGVVRRRDR